MRLGQALVLVTRRRAAVVVIVAALHVGRAAAGPEPGDLHLRLAAELDPPKHFQTPSHVTTQGGSELDLPPGYFLDEPAWDALDYQVRTLQDDRTRLSAENKSLRDSAGTGAPWWAIAAGVVVGAAAGAYAWERWGP